MKNTTLVRNHSSSNKLRKSVRGTRDMRLESLEIRDLLAANTLDFVDNLEIASPGETRDLQLEVAPSSGYGIVSLRIHGTSGNLDPAVPLVFIQDTDRNNPANHVPLMQAMPNYGGTTDSLVVFQVNKGQNYTIQVGGTSGSGGFIAEVMHFGSIDGDGVVTETEYMKAVAAELQARGAGNHNTALYFQTVYGIDFNQSQYNPAFDANMNGKVDGFEVGYVEWNKGRAPVILDLIGDNEAPAVQAVVIVDTGNSGTDNITADTTGITGTITDFSKIVSAQVSIQGGTGGSIDLADPATLGTITGLGQDDNLISFTLDIDDLDVLLGSGTVLNTGKYTLEVTTVDELGNTSITPFQLLFEFDTDAPSAPGTPNLADASDSGQSDMDDLTNLTKPSFTLTAEAFSTVSIFSSINGLLGTAVADSLGNVVFTYPAATAGLSEGVHDITATATDIAGNQSAVSLALSIEIDTLAPADVAAIVLVNKSTNNNLTGDAFATFSGTTEANAFVDILDSNNTVVASTTADGAGNFAFVAGDNIALVLGENNFSFVATDAAGNSADPVPFTVFSNNAPSITPETFFVDENAVAGTSLGNVMAISGDGMADTLTYAITGIDMNYDGAFKINASTGELQVNDQSLLNFEDKSSFTIEITVTDSSGNGLGGAGLVAVEDITVKLQDINEAPEFQNTPYTMTVEENAAVNDLLGGDSIVVVDEDGDDQSPNLTYAIISGNTDGYFKIDEDTGVISVAKLGIDFEMQSQYSLLVQVSDNVNGDNSGEIGQVNMVTQLVTVNVVDVNEAPEFVGDPFVFDVREDAASTDSVGFVVVDDEDTDDMISGNLSYTITGGTGDGLFTIDEDTGEITVTALGASTFDFDMGDQSYELDIEVVDNLDSGNGEIGSVNKIMTTVKVNLLDVNEAPVFTTVAFADLPEDAANGASVGFLTATDEDGDDQAGKLTFAISGADAKYFDIDATTGEITVLDNSIFDFEAKNGGRNTFSLNVSVTDNLNGNNDGEQGQQITVDDVVTINLSNVNELPSENSVDLGQITWEYVNDMMDPENTGLSVGLVDPDAGDSISYTPATDTNNHFEIDANGNLIFNQKNPVTKTELDNASGEINFSIDVTITDDNMASKVVTVTFQVVENAPPVFTSPAPNSSYDVIEYISGDADNLMVGEAIDDLLDIQAYDPDSDPVNEPLVDGDFTLASGNPALAALFAIDDDLGGNRTIVIADDANLRYDYVVLNGASESVENIDGEDVNVATFTIHIVATDDLNGTTTLPVTIRLLNRNDVPVFMAPGTNPTVEEQVVHADPMDNNIAAGTFVYDLNNAFSDPDNFFNDEDHLTYSIASSTYSAAFAIGGTNSNELVVADASILNFEQLALTGDTTIDLQITAVDPEGEMITKTISIDVLDQNELPLYDANINIQLDFDALMGEANNQVKSFAEVFGGQDDDPEGDSLVFNQGGPAVPTMSDDEFYFSIDPNGNIILENEITFGAMEEERTFVLTYDYEDSQGLSIVDDLGYAAESFQLTITVSKNQAPEFLSNDFFDVDENAAGNGQVLLIEVSDPEMEDITFKLEDDPEGAFLLTTVDAETSNSSPASAKLTLADGSKLDHEALTNGQYTLTISAMDVYGRITEQYITVTVNDVNEAPVFTTAPFALLPEDAAIGATVGTLTATDVDADDDPSVLGDLTYAISGADAAYFSIDPDTGVITVADNSAFDFEEVNGQKVFTLDVSVTDKLDGDGNGEEGMVQTTNGQVTITLDNVNEAPEFTGADFALPLVDEFLLTSLEIGTLDDGVYSKFFSNLDYDFLGQFTDPEGDALTLTIANQAAIENLDYVQSISYDSDPTTGGLSVTFLHFGTAQNRDPFTIQFDAVETASGNLPASTPLLVDAGVKTQKSVDIRLIPVSAPSDSANAFTGISEGELPISVDRFADGQTFSVEVWATTLVGKDDVAKGTAWVEGFRSVTLDLEYDVNFLSTSQGNVVDPIRVADKAEVNDTTGYIDGFNAFFGLDADLMGSSQGYDGEYVRLGYINFTIKDGVSTNGMSLQDLVTIVPQNPPSPDGTVIQLDGADDEDVDPGADMDINNDFAPQTPEVQADVVGAQTVISYPNIEIVDAEKFTISSANSQAVIGILGESTIGGVDVTGQGGNGKGNVTSFSGDVYVVFNGDEMDPTSFEILGAELILTENLNGPFNPGEPTTQGGLPVGNAQDPANFGLEAFQSQDNYTQVAVRETVLRIAGLPEVTFSPGNNPFNSAVNFDSSGFDYSIASGFADVYNEQPFMNSTLTFAGRNDLSDISLQSNGTETSTIEGDNNGGYVLTLNLSRLIQETFTAQQVSAFADLAFSGTIVATTGGAVPLQGTVFAKDGQPLEDGTGLFVTVSKDRTVTDTSGQVTVLPDSDEWVSEWDSMWVEVWGNTAEADGVYGGLVDLAYDTNLFSATEIEYAPTMNINRTGVIDDATGTITGLGSQSTNYSLGNGSFVLLGRVKLESLPDDGIDVSVGGDLSAESLGLVATNAQVMLSGIGSVDPDVTDVADVDVWAVAYDADDNGKIGLSDFTSFISVYGQSTLTADTAMLAALDFDNSGKVGLADFTSFISNYGKTKQDAGSIVYPDTFRQMWVGKGVEMNGPDSLQQVFDKAVSDWQEALGWEEPIDVKLVVKDFGDAQLGEAELLGLDENGLPQFGILTLDDDGAGLGWSADLEGGPAEGQYDLYTVILHELGHLYGFMSHYSGFADNVITDHEGNKIFVGSDFVAVLDDYAHHLDSTEHMGDAMNGTLDPGQRKTISALDVQILETAYASATAGQTLTNGSAALHAAITTELIVEETIAPTAPVAPVETESPVSFVFDNVVDVETVSGRTGYEAPISPIVYNELIKNGVRVTTSSSTEVQQQIEEFDSAVATLVVEDSLLLADSVEDAEYFATEEDSTSVDDLFADWDFNSDLEG